MELENILITSKQPECKENETLNFLFIFVCYVSCTEVFQGIRFFFL